MNGFLPRKTLRNGIIVHSHSQVVHDKLSAIETILSNTTILPIGKHVLEGVTSTSLALTGAIVLKPSSETKKNAIILILITMRKPEVASVDTILAQAIVENCFFTVFQKRKIYVPSLYTVHFVRIGSLSNLFYYHFYSFTLPK